MPDMEITGQSRFFNGFSAVLRSIWRGATDVGKWFERGDIARLLTLVACDGGGRMHSGSLGKTDDERGPGNKLSLTDEDQTGSK